MKTNFLVISFSLLTICFTSAVFSQDKDEEQRIINTVPSKVPLKIKIINGGMKSLLEDIEIRVTNTGQRPIYYLDLTLASETEFVPAHRVGLTSFTIGNGRLGDFSLQSPDTLAFERSSTTAFEPGETKVFGVTKVEREGFWNLMMEKGYNRDAKIVLELTILSFGDGRGYMTRGAVEMPNKKDFSPVPDGKKPLNFFLLP